METKKVGETVLDYFSAVGGDETPSGIPERSGGDAGLGFFDRARVEALLRAHKKTKSRVKGDPLPHLIRIFPGQFAVPVAMIFNAVNTAAQWPGRWKEEHLTIIPKCPKPNDLSDCRNISCTPMLSKILEAVVLEKLRGKLVSDANQYGGNKGCGAEHMVVEIWDRILRVLDGGDKAACLLGIDYEKAFNRMDHGHCLRQLQKLGASEGSLRMVTSFLENRRMAITIDDEYCGFRDITRGSPQGSVLGCLLYCVTTQNLTDRGETTANFPVRPMTTLPDTPGNDFEDRPTDPRGASADAMPRFFPGSQSDDSDEDVNFWDDGASPEWQEQLDRAPEDINEEASFKYIDDTTTFAGVPLSWAVRHITAGPTLEVIQPLVLERGLIELSRKSREIGMKVNVKKTQLLCVSPNNGCHTSAAIRTSDG